MSMEKTNGEEPSLASPQASAAWRFLMLELRKTGRMEWWSVDLGLWERKRMGKRAENGWKREVGGNLE